MKKHMSKLVLFLVGFLLIGILVACGESEKESVADPSGDVEENDDAETHDEEKDTGPVKKIGVSIQDATDSEMVAFRRYYEEYIEEHYNVEFLFSGTITTAEEERTSAENFINQGVEAIISFSDEDRPAIIEMLEEAGVYYAVGAGTLDDEQFERFKDYEYYIGSIGPSLADEEAIGYDMAKHYLDQGYTNFLLYAGGYPYVDMHLMRTHGMIRAFEEVGVTYNDGGDGQLGTFESDKYTIATIDGFPDDSGAFFGTVGERVNEPGLEVIVSAALGVEFFGTALAQSGNDIRLGTVASFADAYNEGFNAGQIDYLAGKFPSSIGPVFAAVYNAIHGDIDAVRNNGEAFRIDQGYWIASNLEEFQQMYEVASSLENPGYTEELLDTVIKTENTETDYVNFESFVHSYSFDEIRSMQN